MVKVFRSEGKYFMQDGEVVVEVGTIMSHGKSYVKLPTNSSNRGFVCVEKIGDDGLILEVKTSQPRVLGTSKGTTSGPSYAKLLEYASEEEKATVMAIFAKCEKALKVAQLRAQIEEQQKLIEELSK